MDKERETKGFYTNLVQELLPILFYYFSPLLLWFMLLLLLIVVAVRPYNDDIKNTNMCSNVRMLVTMLRTLATVPTSRCWRQCW